MFSLGEVIDIAVQIEENGESFYRSALEKGPDSALENLLRWLADEELRHRKCFLHMRSALKASAEDRLKEQLSGTILQSAVGEHAFSLDEADLSSLTDEIGLIETALGFERDSILFYEMIQSFVKDPLILDQTNEIIEEERRHVELLEKRLELVVESASAKT